MDNDRPLDETTSDEIITESVTLRFSSPNETSFNNIRKGFSLNETRKDPKVSLLSEGVRARRATSVNIDNTEIARYKLFKKCKKGDVDAVDTLIQMKVGTNYCNDEGTPLTLAVKQGKVSMVMSLLQSPDILVNLQDRGGQSPLILASKLSSNPGNVVEINNNFMIGKLLINSPHININIQDLAGNTALMYCTLMDNSLMVKQLLDAKADVNMTNIMGMTALHNAASTQSSSMILMLISHGAKQVRDKEGHLPVDITTNLEIKKLLRGKKTSLSHPFVIDFMDHNLCPLLQQSRIGMSMCPGRIWRDWSRDFDMDIEVMLSYKVEVVCSIITNTELRQMTLFDFHERLKKKGMSIIELSIHDKWVPSSVSAFLSVIEAIVVKIRQGKIILVHCNGGKGRTGLVVAACLVVLGCLPDQAVHIVRAARSGMLRNPAQEAFLHMLKSKLQSEEKIKEPENQNLERNLTVPGSPQAFLKKLSPRIFRRNLSHRDRGTEQHQNTISVIPPLRKSVPSTPPPELAPFPSEKFQRRKNSIVSTMERHDGSSGEIPFFPVKPHPLFEEKYLEKETLSFSVNSEFQKKEENCNGEETLKSEFQKKEENFRGEDILKSEFQKKEENTQNCREKEILKFPIQVDNFCVLEQAGNGQLPLDLVLSGGVLH